MKRHMQALIVADAFEMGFAVETIEAVVKRRLCEIGMWVITL